MSIPNFSSHGISLWQTYERKNPSLRVFSSYPNWPHSKVQSQMLSVPGDKIGLNNKRPSSHKGSGSVCYPKKLDKINNKKNDTLLSDLMYIHFLR